MSQSFPPPVEPSSPPPVPEQSGWDDRQRTDHRSGNPWVVGTVLILLGLIFLLRNYGIFDLYNWWAVFILIPAVGSFASAWRIYQHNGQRMSTAVRGPFIGGLILSMVAAAFLFNLNWGLIWPIFVILAGVGALITALVPD